MKGPASKPDDFIVFGQPCIGREEIDAVVEVMESRWIGTGPRCRRLEEAFASLKGVGDAVAVSSCTAALFLALRELGVAPGTEVVTSPVTFAASSNVIEHLGARPRFVDVDPATGNMDPAAAVEAVTDRTSAILVVHLAGRPVEMEPLLEVRERRGVPVVEDCAHATVGSWRGRATGTIGDAGAFSFYATKNVTTAEGGILLMRDEERLARCRRLSMHGLTADAWTRYNQAAGFRHFQVVEPGYKFNLTDIAAAIGLVQLDRLGEHQGQRARLFDHYGQALADLPLDLPPPADDRDDHAFHLYSPRLRVDEVSIGRDDLLAGLIERGVGCGVHYVSLHLHPYYRDRYAFQPDELPAALRFSETSFSIPLTGCLPLAVAGRVVGALEEVLEGVRI